MPGTAVLQALGVTAIIRKVCMAGAWTNHTQPAQRLPQQRGTTHRQLPSHAANLPSVAPVAR
jgi:hypothetical protein